VEVAAGVGVPFILSGRVRQGGTGEEACGQWWGFNSRPFRGVKGGGESMGTKLVRESEGSQAALRFGSVRVQEGGRWRHATRWRGWMGGGGLGVVRKEKGPRWAGAGPQRPGGPECSGGLKQVDVP
jgi:hypothetical protein